MTRLDRPAPITLPDDDDTPIGRVLTRREVLALFGGTTVALAATGATSRVLAQDPVPSASPGAVASPSLPSCIVRPALPEGPLFVDVRLERSDLRLDTDGSIAEGTPLELTFLASRLDGTARAAFPGVTVGVWHCDAAGLYSAVDAMCMQTTDQVFLRGHQVTDGTGRAAFTTIVPGWYPGRAVHIHIKLRSIEDEQTTWDFTSQLFFDEDFLAAAYQAEPYAARPVADVPNARDRIFQAGGEQLLLVPTATGDGYAATFPIGLQVS